MSDTCGKEELRSKIMDEIKNSGINIQDIKKNYTCPSWTNVRFAGLETLCSAHQFVFVLVLSEAARKYFRAGVNLVFRTRILRLCCTLNATYFSFLQNFLFLAVLLKFQLATFNGYRYFTGFVREEVRRTPSGT